MEQDISQSWRGRRRARAMRRVGMSHVVIDVDGVFTDGMLNVGQDGRKLFKSFGLDDHAAIKRWRDEFPIHVISSDDQNITRERMAHMQVPYTVVPAGGKERVSALAVRYGHLGGIVYIGDGYHDWEVMQSVGYGIAPANAWPATRRAADAVTHVNGGRRAVAVALDHIGRMMGL